MVYAKILKTELDDLIALKDEYYNTCLKLYNDIDNQNQIIKAMKLDCETLSNEKDNLLASIDEEIITASDVPSKRSTVNVILNNIDSLNQDVDVIAMKEKYIV